MNTDGRIRNALFLMKLQHILGGSDPSADRVMRAVDAIIAQARREEKAGARRDRVLNLFESRVETIMDGITHLQKTGEKEAYREACAKLYTFAEETMRDSYMSMYLYILYKYANAVLEAGQPQEAMPLFDKLCQGTDRLIGSSNPYYVHCLERYAVSSMRAGCPQETKRATDKMYRIASEDFGVCSAMMMAVRRFTARLRAEAETVS